MPQFTAPRPAASPMTGEVGIFARSGLRTSTRGLRCAAGLVWLAAGCVGDVGAHDVASQPTTDPHAGHQAGQPSMVIDLSSLPQGDPGYAQAQLSDTDEQPAYTDGVGAFRTRCKFSHMNYDDAIVYPGKPGSSHLHTYLGNALTDAYSTADSLRDTGNSTCRGGTINRSSYWVPTLFDASGTPQVPLYADIYYKSGYEGIAASTVQAFPKGLRMIAGDATSRAQQKRALWNCDSGGQTATGAILDCPAGDKLVMYVQFPQCWDGKNTDSSDHKSHMAYPENSACPSSHPVAVVELTYRLYFDVPEGGTAGWRLASDAYDTATRGGYSVHGDYFEAWDPDIMETFIEDCVRPGLDCHSHLLGDGRMMY